MNTAFSFFKAMFAGSVGMVILGLLDRTLRFQQFRDPDEPGLSGPQRMGIGKAQEALRSSPWLIRFGFLGAAICFLGMLVTTILR